MIISWRWSKHKTLLKAFTYQWSSTPSPSLPTISHEPRVIVQIEHLPFLFPKDFVLSLQCELQKTSLTNNKRLFYLSIAPSLVIHSMISFSWGYDQNRLLPVEIWRRHTHPWVGVCASPTNQQHIYTKTKQEFSIQPPHTPQHQPQSNVNSIPRDQLKKLICRNDSSLGVHRTYTDLTKNLVNFTSWHFITRTNVLEDVLNAISTDGGMSIVLTGGRCGFYDILTESTRKFLGVAVVEEEEEKERQC